MVKRTAKKSATKNNFASAAHFFVHFFAVVLHDHNVKLSSYTFYGEKNVVCAHRRFVQLVSVPVRFPFTAAHFYLAGFSLLTASISHFLTADINCHVVFPTKFVSFVFYLSL